MVAHGSKSKEMAWPFFSNGTIWKNGNKISMKHCFFQDASRRQAVKKQEYFGLIKYHFGKNARAKTFLRTANGKSML